MEFSHHQQLQQLVPQSSLLTLLYQVYQRRREVFEF